jgi:hypothetical protein
MKGARVSAKRNSKALPSALQVMQRRSFRILHQLSSMALVRKIKPTQVIAVKREERCYGQPFSHRMLACTEFGIVFVSPSPLLD